MGYARSHGIRALCFDIDGTFYPKRQMLLRLFASSVLHLPFALKYNAMRQQLREETGVSEGDTYDLDSFRKKEAAIVYPGRSFQSVFCCSILREVFLISRKKKEFGTTIFLLFRIKKFDPVRIQQVFPSLFRLFIGDDGIDPGKSADLRKRTFVKLA